MMMRRRMIYSMIMITPRRGGRWQWQWNDFGEYGVSWLGINNLDVDCHPWSREITWCSLIWLIGVTSPYISILTSNRCFFINYWLFPNSVLSWANLLLIDDSLLKIWRLYSINESRSERPLFPRGKALQILDLGPGATNEVNFASWMVEHLGVGHWGETLARGILCRNSWLWGKVWKQANKNSRVGD